MRFQSALSDPKYGYDFVVATTQKSINATMKTYLKKLNSPVVVVCYVADEKGEGNPVLIDHAELVTRANGTDPFSIPANADPRKDPGVRNLLEAQFMMGFKAQLGLPPGVKPLNMPDIVELGGGTSAVTYNMLCSQFTIVELNPGGGYASKPTWMSLSQPSGEPWIFSSKVDLRMSTVDRTAYANLPPDVQKAIKNIGGDAFSVKQLLFDLDNAGLQSMPKIKGVAPGTNLERILNQFFVGAYFGKMKSLGQPLLGAAVTQSTAPISTLTLTDLNLNVCTFLGDNSQPVKDPTPQQQGLATLNYLCAADGAILPPAVQFSWNWVEPAEAGDVHGVVAVNRRDLARYFHNQLRSRAESCCFTPSVTVAFEEKSLFLKWGASFTAGAQPTVECPSSGETILKFSYSGFTSDRAGADGWAGEMKLIPSYSMDVSFSGSKITIVQKMRTHLDVRSLATQGNKNVVDKTMTEIYNLAVDQNGRLVSTPTAPVLDDKSESMSVDWFIDLWTDFNKISETITNLSRTVAAAALQSIPISVVQDFVFPGGKTFTYKSVGFSQAQDLISHITYADPEN
jgi:hypothetical protein